MSRLCNYVDICIANEEDARNIFDIEADKTDINNGKHPRGNALGREFRDSKQILLMKIFQKNLFFKGELLI